MKAVRRRKKTIKIVDPFEEVDKAPNGEENKPKSNDTGGSIRRVRYEKDLFKDVLRRNKKILIRNLTPCPEMMAMFKEHKIFTESMITDITQAKSRKETVQLILDLIPLRGHATFRTFCDILHVTGHSLLAELLTDDGGTASLRVSINDLASRYPLVDRNLRSSDKGELEEYVEHKVKEYFLKHKLRNTSERRENTLDLKQRTIEMSWTHQKALQHKEECIKNIENRNKDSKAAMDWKLAEIKSIIADQHRQKDKLKQDLKVQYDFNLANDKSLQRYQQKIDEQNRLLLALCHKLKDNGQLWENDDISESVDVTKRFDLFLTRVKELEDYRLKYNKLVEDQNHLLSHVISSSEIEATDEHCLMNALNDFIHKKDLEIMALQEDVNEFKNRISYLENRHKDVLKEFETMQTRAMELEYKMNQSSDSESDGEDPKERGRSRASSNKSKKVSYDYESEINRLKDAIEQKDATINLLEFEINRLKQDKKYGKNEMAILNGLVTTRDKTNHPFKPRTKSGRNSEKTSAKTLPPLKINKRKDSGDVRSPTSVAGTNVVTDFDLNGWDHIEYDTPSEPTVTPDMFRNTNHPISKSPNKNDKNLSKSTPVPAILQRQTSSLSMQFGYKFNRKDSIDSISGVKQKMLQPEF